MSSRYYKGGSKSRVETSDNPFFEEDEEETKPKRKNGKSKETTSSKPKTRRLVPKKYTTEGVNPKSLPAGSGPPSLAELNRKTSSEKATVKPLEVLSDAYNRTPPGMASKLGRATAQKISGALNKPKTTSSNPRTNRARSTAKTTPSRGTMARSLKPGTDPQKVIKRGQEKMIGGKTAPARLGTTSQMKKDQDMISGIGARAAKGKTPAKKKTDLGIMGMGLGPKTNRQRVEDAVSQGVKMPNTGSKKVTKTGPKTNTDNTVSYSEATRPKKKAPVKKGRAATKPFLPAIGGAPDYSELTRPKKKAPVKKGRAATKTVDNKVNYSEATRPKGSKDLIGDNKVDYSEATKPVKKTTKSKTAKSKPAAKEKSFRERRAERLKKRLASESVGESRKKRIKRRLSRVEGRIEKAKDKKEEKARKPKKMMGGGEYKKYAEGKLHRTSTKPKLKGIGITQKGVRPCKMR